MTDQMIAQRIHGKAMELGYEKCGIVPLEMLSGYGEKLEERIQKIPQSREFYEGQKRLVDPKKEFPWAESVVIVVEKYGIYKIPEQVRDHIGKHYLFDARIDENAKEYQTSIVLESYMQEFGLKTANNRKFGLVGLRWVALTAGLGIIRRNNFFYTKSGSWVTLQAWLIDKNLQLLETPDLPQCPKGCSRCSKACPTGSLSAPYTMSPTKCISFLTTFGGHDLPNEPLRKKFESCIYGCDICQNVCPMNQGKWKETEDFPEIEDLAPFLTPEKILEMSDDFYQSYIQPKFFYLKPDELWKWKVNVLCYLDNHYEDKYKPYLKKACEDRDDKIREMAQSIINQHF
jgi:epoxyqueuosine reductase